MSKPDWWADPDYEPTDADFEEMFASIEWEPDPGPPPRPIVDVPPSDLL